MSRDKVVVLDSGFVGYLFHPKHRDFLNTWSTFINYIDAQVFLPAIIDFEFRRKCNLNKFTYSLGVLSKYRQRDQYLEITASDLDLAADLWAYCRIASQATTDSKKLDVDVILVAQAVSLLDDFPETIIATSDPDDLSIFQDRYDFQIWDWRTALDDINRGSITFYKKV